MKRTEKQRRLIGFSFFLSLVLLLSFIFPTVKMPFHPLWKKNFGDLQTDIGWRYELPLFTAVGTCKVSYQGVEEEVYLRSFDLPEDVSECFIDAQADEFELRLIVASISRFKYRKVEFPLETIGDLGGPPTMIIKQERWEKTNE